MPDAPDNILSILVQLGVIGEQDVAAAKDLLSETGQAAGKDMATSLPEGSEAWAKYKTALSGAGEGAENAHEKLHGLRQLMKAAGPEARELGHLLHFALNPAAIVTALGVGGLELYFHHLEKIEEKYHEMIEAGAKVEANIRAIISARPSALQEWMTLTEQVAKLEVHLSNAKFVMDQFNAASKAQTDNRMGAIGEQEKSATAVINTMKNRGLINDAQAAAMTDALHAREQSRTHYEERGKIIDEAARTRGDLEHLQNITPDSKSAQKTANDAEQQLKNMRELMDDKGDFQKQIKTLKEDAEKERKEAKKYGAMETETRDKFMAQADSKEERARQLEGLIPSKSAFDASAQAAAQAAQNLKEQQENTAEIRRLKEQLVTLGNQLAQFDDKTKKMAAAESGGTGAHAMNVGIDVADTMLGGGKTTKGQQKYIVELASQIAGHNVSLQEAVTVLETGAHSSAAFMSQVSRLTRIFSAYRPADIALMETRISEIEMKLQAGPGWHK